MGITTYFFDTYALYEIIVGNPNYKKYSIGIAIVTTRLQLMELHYALLRTYSKEIADEKYDAFIDYCILIDDATIKEAMLFKFQNKSRKLSYVDCIGYLLAKKLNILFLTGDQQFETFENVEYVK
ncbi:PIN domain nuclease [Candidatus Woesearchaeota archaeon CG10_big_fil_rev_8_21_14_0_10_37_12]|nr:MAG: PIN domain nuclease [Candidatus Woesearchaeota archaeon CG10_big_fil_rev_8_21_14_0_10_37_12]